MFFSTNIFTPSPLIRVYTYLKQYNQYMYALPETNIAPENGWLEYEFSCGMDYVQ